ncbi:MAG: GTPase HflX [Verrucomicrobia bacterium]|nr:GTPase HflX [Verrucomicrobiota bacterium]MCF7708967.1 GTPase HflX [Verrucomicrobiota bacterium]
MNKKTEKVFLIGADIPDGNHGSIDDSIEELASLAITAGGEVIGSGCQRLRTPSSSTFIGSGKAEEFSTVCREREVDTVIFDDELTPAQNRNLEKIFDCKVLDRTTLILDIFAQRARTREGKLQVELAQLQHLLPRLTRFWTHLSRQKGGIGMRGEGEKQLETDRRKVQERIDKLSAQLEEVRKRRKVQRLGRKRNQWPLASIVGYTNAGKSTLFNAITGASAFEEDKLFATLDPTTRRLRLPTNQNILISDTVGFIKKLPHRLVASFKATLEEVVQADLLIHVVDAGRDDVKEHIQAVNEVLHEIGANDKSTVMVFNKIDRLTNLNVVNKLSEIYPDSVAVSAKEGTGLEQLVHELGLRIRPERAFLELRVPAVDSSVIARAYSVGQVVESRYEGTDAILKVRMPPQFVEKFRDYLIREL